MLNILSLRIIPVTWAELPTIAPFKTVMTILHNFIGLSNGISAPIL